MKILIFGVIPSKQNFPNTWRSDFACHKDIYIYVDFVHKQKLRKVVKFALGDGFPKADISASQIYVSRPLKLSDNKITLSENCQQSKYSSNKMSDKINAAEMSD